MLCRSRLVIVAMLSVAVVVGKGADVGRASVGQRTLEESFGYSFGAAGDYEFTVSVNPVPGGIVVGGVTDPSGVGSLYQGSVIRFDDAGQEEWSDVLATSGNTELQDVAASSNTVVAVGNTSGSITGEPLQGEYDGFIRWYTSAGQVVRDIQFGNAAGDSSGQSVAIGQDGSVYVAGYTHGSLDGPSAGDADVVIRRYGPDGTLAWARQFGTGASDAAEQITVRDDRIYVAGLTRGALAGDVDPDDAVFVGVLSAATGQTIWMRQFSTPEVDRLEALDVGSDHLYVGGGSRFYALSLDGVIDWTRQVAQWEDVRGLAATPTGVVATGSKVGEAVAPDSATPGLDTFVRGYDGAGVLEWGRVLSGEPSRAEVADDAAYGPDGVYIAGDGNGGLFGGEVGSVDSFVARYTLQQPDVMARRRNGPLVGSDTYAPRQLSQVSARVLRGGRTTFRVAVQNDGEAPSAFRVRGCGDRSGVRVRYFSGARDVTAAVRLGWRTPVLPVGRTKALAIRVRVASSAVLGARTCTVSSHSVHRKVGEDRIVLTIRAVRR